MRKPSGSRSRLTGMCAKAEYLSRWFNRGTQELSWGCAAKLWRIHLSKNRIPASFCERLEVSMPTRLFQTRGWKSVCQRWYVDIFHSRTCWTKAGFNRNQMETTWPSAALRKRAAASAVFSMCYEPFPWRLAWSFVRGHKHGSCARLVFQAQAC